MLDCEAVPWDKKQKCILPFQVLQTRKRKDVSSEDIQVSVCVFAFDLLYLNGEALTQRTLAERRALLHENFSLVEGVFNVASSMDGKSVEDIQVEIDSALLTFA